MHAAAGLADSVDRDAARLLRAFEVLAGAVVALLEVSARRTVRSPNAVVGPAAGTVPGAPAAKGPTGAAGVPGADAVQPGTSAGAGGATGRPAARSSEEQGANKQGSKVKPERRKQKKKKGNTGTKGKTKDSGDKGGKGKKKPETTEEVDTVPGGEMERDDRWADKATFSTPAAVVEQPAPTVAVGTPIVNPGVTAVVLELGYKDTLLKTSGTATVVNYGRVNKALNSETGTLFSFDGKVWGVMMDTGPRRDQTVYIPSIHLQGHDGTVP